MPKNILKKHFGFEQFREGQKDVIETLLKKESAAAIFPTGSGKSLCYQLPAIQLPHLTLVVSPLLALIQDQLDFLRSKNIGAVRIDSTLSKDEERSTMNSIRDGGTKILMISVERFKNERFRRFLQQIPISLLVIDEAHCISEWGHNFRPDYLKLPHYKKYFKIPQVLLLTATATPQVVNDMCNKFNIESNNVIQTGFYRSNLHLHIEGITEENKTNRLIEIIKSSISQPSIIYVTQQKTAETQANILMQSGINARAYHAGMKSDEREQIQHDFMNNKINCIVATIAFGMGIDKSNIRRVIHYDLPKSIENYSQEIGRAGRDGKDSDCYVLANKANLHILENFIYGDTPELNDIKIVLEDIPTDGTLWEIKLLQLSNKCNIKQLPLKTLLVYLEMQNIITSKYSYYADYRYSNLVDDKQILSMFNGERKSFIQAIFDNSTKARKWITVNFEKIQSEYSCNRERIISALEFFDEKSLIQLEAKQSIDVFEVINPLFSLDTTSKTLFDLFSKKEEIEVSRIYQMLNLFESKNCLSYNLANYFGQIITEKNCGHCSVCQSTPAIIPGNSNLEALESKDFNQICSALLSKSNNNLSTNIISKFLCGISLPIFAKLKAKQLSGYGILSDYQYEQILNWVNQNYSLHN